MQKLKDACQTTPTVADTVAHTMASTRTHVQGTLLVCEVHMHLDDLE